MYDCCLYTFQEQNYLFQLEVNADTRKKRSQKRLVRKVLEGTECSRRLKEERVQPIID